MACKRPFSEVSVHEEAWCARVTKVQEEIAAWRTRVLANTRYTPDQAGSSQTQWCKLGAARRLLADLQLVQPIALSAAPRPETGNEAPANPPVAARSNHLPLRDVDEVQTAHRVSELLPKIKDTEMSEMSCTFCTCVSEGQCPHCTQRICKTHLWECCSVPLRLEQLNPVGSVADTDFHCLCCDSPGEPIVDAVGQCPGCFGQICRRHFFSCCKRALHAESHSYHDSYVSALPNIRRRWKMERGID